jgi:hypothetical protein
MDAKTRATFELCDDLYNDVDFVFFRVCDMISDCKSAAVVKEQVALAIS